MKKDQTPPPSDPNDEVEILINPVESILGGRIRGEVAGCPTGCSIPARRPKKEGEDEAAKTPEDGKRRE